ncbi:copper amine oxidase N-terminal domain-containing protein [Paenibacillus sp. TH7-28]
MRFKVSLLGLLLFLSMVPAALAAENIQLDFNGKLAETSAKPVNKDGSVYVPIRVVEEIEGLTISSWDNASKTLTIAQRGTDAALTLKVGEKSAKKGSQTIGMSQPAQVINNRVMVPLRFVAEAFDADVAWNPDSKTVYVAKTTEQQKKSLHSGDLTAARLAALNLPRISSLPDLDFSGDSLGTWSIYFPEGEYKSFFTVSNEVISYYRITDNAAQLIWEAALNAKQSKESTFYAKGIIKEQGTRPEIKTNLIFYDISTHAGQAQYGRIHTDGTVKQLGTKEMNNLDELFPIEEENAGVSPLRLEGTSEAK